MKKVKLGELIEKNSHRNLQLKYGKSDVMGMTITKEIIPTKANIKDNELPRFWIVEPNDFIYNPRTHGAKIGLGFNNSSKSFIISWNNITFRVKLNKLCELDPNYLFIYFNRAEWDRRACFDSWGSSTEVFSWEALCDMNIELPDIDIQRKYVNIYKGMQENLAVYQSNLEDLKLVCDGYIEDLRRNMKSEKIGRYIERTDIRNSDNMIKKVMGVSVYKELREPTSKVNKSELRNYKIVKPREITFVQTTHNEKVFAFAINNLNEDIVVTSVNEVFYTDEKNLIPEYLCMWFSRKEFDRYARFHSWGSARETFTWNDLQEVEIPIPDIKIQESIVRIFNAYNERKRIVDELKGKISGICSILVRGAIKEGGRV